MTKSPFRRPVRELAELVEFRKDMHSPCWVIRTPDNCALIVPTLHGRMEYLRTFKRATITEAVAMRLVVLGDELEKVPGFTGVPSWLLKCGADMGRMISIPASAALSARLVKGRAQASAWNSAHPVGTRVVAYPGVRPEGGPAELCTRLETVTRSEAWCLGHGDPVVMVEGHSGGIALTHVDVVGGAS